MVYFKITSTQILKRVVYILYEKNKYIMLNLK